MSDDSIPVSVQIMDNEYRVACPADESEALQEAARHLNETMQGIRSTGKVLGVERIAVIAALNISYELLKCKKQGAESGEFANERLQQLLDKVETALRKSG